MKKLTLPSLLLLAALILAACSAPAASLQSQAVTALQQAANSLAPQAPANDAQAPALQTTPAAPVTLPAEAAGLLAAYEGALTSIYDQVNPSVVNIRVLVDASQAMSGFPGLPEGEQMPELPFELPFNLPGMPGSPETPQDEDSQLPEMPQYGEGAGSGFVWDQNGHIVTNNHVIDGAEKIEVTFSDGTAVPAELVGADPDSDLAVLKVDVPASQLAPVQLGDSDQLRVGQLAIAIGNPFGLEGSMTVGIISALGRTMPAGETLGGTSYSIPDVIQTDAPINPGNSGGVLVNDKGQVIGVTFAIESPVRASAGIGFVIPSAIVERVAPSLIEDGEYEHPYLGISAGDLTPDLAEAMDLDRSLRGILVGEVVTGGPADKAGLRGSNSEAEIDGQSVNVGGDIITAIEGAPLQGMDDLISYLSSSTSVGQEVTLTILRDGQEQAVQVTLGARPAQQARQTPENEQQPQQQPKATGRAWLGITAGSLRPEAAEAMGLEQDQTGVLVQEVQPGSPADDAGLRGGSETIEIEGQEVLIGGDVIIGVATDALDGESISTMEELIATLQQLKPGQQVSLTVLRDGQQVELQVTLGERPAGQ